MVRFHTASMGWVLWRRHGVHFCLLVVLRFTLLMVRWAGLHAVRLSGLHSLTLQLPLLSRLREGVFKRLSRCAPKIISHHPRQLTAVFSLAGANLRAIKEARQDLFRIHLERSRA